MLEKELKAANIPWEDKCFNVDSFQGRFLSLYSLCYELTYPDAVGNEEDHIIISLVRSDKIGFLQNIRRMNVMLSRCKKSMKICTSRGFLEDIAASSLVGKLAKMMGEQAWIDL